MGGDVVMIDVQVGVMCVDNEDVEMGECYGSGEISRVEQ
jgi:hypothetical protein